MKTIGFRDHATGRNGTIHCYFKEGETRHERIENALKDLKHTGRIAVFLIKGRKARFLFNRF